MRTIERIACSSVLALTPFAPLPANAVTIGEGNTAEAAVNIGTFAPSTFPVTRAAATIRFGTGDPFDAGEQILMRFFNGANVEVGTAQCTNKYNKAVYSTSCLSTRMNQGISASDWRIELESLAGTMEIDAASMVVHSASGPRARRERVELNVASANTVSYAPIDWSPGVFYQTATLRVHQGYFPDVAPYEPEGFDVIGSTYPETTWGPAFENTTNPRYPVAYSENVGAAPGSQTLMLKLHSFGSGEGWCHSWSNDPQPDVLEIRVCEGIYPLAADYGLTDHDGHSWWGYHGGTTAHPEWATNHNGERLAQAAIEIQGIYANVIDFGAGIWLSGPSMGATGVILQAMLIPRIQDQVSVVYSDHGFSLFVEQPEGLLSGYKTVKMWGSADRDAANFRIQAANGSLDHIFFRGVASSQDDITPHDPEFYQICNDNRIACLGTWDASTAHGVDETDINWTTNATGPVGFPDRTFPDGNWEVRLDSPLVVFTNSTGNNWGVRGHYNLGLSWNTAAIEESTNGLTIPIRYWRQTNMSLDQQASPLPDMPAAVTVDLTIRRSNVFVFQPGQSYQWSYDSQSGVVTADNKAEITIVGLAMNSSGDHGDLIVTRQPFGCE